MTLRDCLLLYGGLACGTGIGFLLAALFSRSKAAAADDLLDSLVELRTEIIAGRTSGDEFRDMIARADFAISNATEAWGLPS